MKIFLLGKRSSVTNWLGEAAAAFVADGHEVRVGIVRDPRLHPGLQRALAQPIATRIARRITAFAPDLVLAVGGFHVPLEVLERIAALAARPPIVGWVGDAFDADAAGVAGRYDLVAYTDTGLIKRHEALGFPSRTGFAPHAVDPHARVASAERSGRMVFVATPTPARRAIVDGITSPLALFGQGWRDNGVHDVDARRLPPGALLGVYARHLASLNIRNEFNVLAGLNQRNFQPYLVATPLVTDDQPDLSLCFEPGREALVWRNIEELTELYARLQREPEEAAAVGARGQQRVLADHTYGQRLAALLELL